MKVLFLFALATTATLLLLLTPTTAAAEEEEKDTGRIRWPLGRSVSAEGSGVWGTSAQCAFPTNVTGVSDVRLSVCVTPPPHTTEGYVYAFFGVGMNTRFFNKAPVQAGALLRWDGANWKACTAHVVCTNAQDECELAWTHCVRARHNDSVALTTAPLADGQSLEYSVVVGAARASVTEHVFLISNWRASGLVFAAAYDAPRVACAALPDEPLVLDSQHLAVPWSRTFRCAWSFGPATACQTEFRNSLGTVILSWKP